MTIHDAIRQIMIDYILAIACVNSTLLVMALAKHLGFGS